MLIYLAPLLLTLSSVTSHQSINLHDHVSAPTAASTAQIKFAMENKYDDTGPANQRPVYAYNTYKTIEDALVAYFDDPDTQLPEQDKSKAMQKLLTRFSKPSRQPHNNLQYSFNNLVNVPYIKSPNPEFNKQANLQNVQVPPNVEKNTVINPPAFDEVKFPRFQAVKDSSLSLAHYARHSNPTFLEYAFPKYSYSYGVHDVATGDIKRAAEFRDGSTVHGFYSVLDPDGTRRVVHYRADDKEGFRASVNKLALA